MPEDNRAPARSALMLLIQDTVSRVRIAAVKSMTKVEGSRAIQYPAGSPR
ncbi:MAG: hypothetical protein IPM58_02965 [Nitrospira sp.]|nr:hypothetical protein [Nitrospira sp.]